MSSIIFCREPWPPCRPSFHFSCTLAKKGQPEGLDARAEQVLSWLAVLEQTRPASGAVCLADRSLKNKSYCFGVGVGFASGVAAAPAGVGVASPLRASLRASLCV